MGSEVMLLRFYRGYYPALVATGAIGGVSWELYHSGSAHYLYGIAEAHVAYVIAAFRQPIFPGLMAGMAYRINLPFRHRLYGEVGLGMDGFMMRLNDGGGNLLTTRELRPLLWIEGGSFAFAEGIFLRYGFYPTPGTTAKFVLTIGSYIGD